jgi:tetratricopeptide (TPR) repeat protein
MSVDGFSADVSAESLKEQGNVLFKGNHILRDHTCSSGFIEKKYVEAVEYYMKAIEKEATVPAYFSNAAAAFANLEEHERAVEMAHRAIELNPSFTKVLHYYNDICRNLI